MTLLLAVVRVVMANTLVDQSVEVATMESQIESINDQSEKIAAAIRNESTIDSVSSRAQLLGFTPINTYSYIPRPQNVAARMDFPLR